MAEKTKLDIMVNAKMGKSLPMKVLRWLWIILTFFLFVTAFVSVYVVPDSMPRLMQITPFLTGLIALMGGIAFGGSAIKRNAILKNGNKNG